MSYGNTYTHQLKDYINTLKKVLKQLLPKNCFNLIYENTFTQVGEREVEAAFYFDNIISSITCSKLSNKITTIQENGIFLTTVNVINKEEPQLLLDFIEIINPADEKIVFPDWLYQYNFLDDKKQNENIDIAKREIEKQMEVIKFANEKLRQNLQYKSILCTNSVELVKVVLEMLEEIFDISLEDFYDERQADFLFKKDNVTYIGEIKGVTSNVRYENISQLEVHYSRYMDKLFEENKEEKIKKILIMNYEEIKILQREII